MGLFEEEHDRIGCHACLGVFWGDRARDVEYRNDDNQHKGVGSGELGEFSAFRDTAKSICSCDDRGGLRGFFGVMFELDFHCLWQWGPNCYDIGMKKSSIDGNQYLYYL
jgi:hypothetical protein